MTFLSYLYEIPDIISFRFDFKVMNIWYIDAWNKFNFYQYKYKMWNWHKCLSKYFSKSFICNNHNIY